MTRRLFLNSKPNSGADDPLSADERVRRVALLCRHCLRNVAFYRAGWRWNHSTPRVDHQFWIATTSSFIDIATLEWCKLFADKTSKHHWTCVVEDPAAFGASLLMTTQLTDAEFVNYTETMKRFRDKFVAHLDNDRVAYLPILWPARRSAALLHDHLLSASIELHRSIEDSAAQFYCRMYRLAAREYKIREARC